MENIPDETFSQPEDNTGGRSLSESERKLHSLLELGQIIGLDLNIDEMLIRIAQKAVEVMNAERFSLFLYDKATDELTTTVALGMGKKQIRLPSHQGIAGRCFQTGMTLNIPDVEEDPDFLKAVDRSTGYRTRNILCMPFLGRSGQMLGVVELVNKKADGAFSPEDEMFLNTFNHQAAVFVEIAQLQKQRIDALQRSQEELRNLNRAKSKALDHLSHELLTPLAIIRAKIRSLKKKNPDVDFDMLETNLSRLLEIQRETNEVIRATHEAEGRSVVDELEHLWKRIEDVSEVTDQTKNLFQAFREYVVRCVPSNPANFRLISLYEIAAEGLSNARAHAHHRNLGFYLEGEESLSVVMEPSILKEVIDGLLKNAIENTPDEGAISVRITSDGQKILLEVQDTGVGITEENKDQIFTGLFHTQETDLYGSGKPYNFNAGGKGLDLLLAKIYAQRFGFDVLLESRRCVHIPTDKDICPGQISRCFHCLSTTDCFSAGGSTFTVSFPSVADPR